MQKKVKSFRVEERVNSDYLPLSIVIGEEKDRREKRKKEKKKEG